MLDKFKAWWDKPYSDDMSVMGWFLFFGFVIFLATMWSLVIREIRQAAA